VVRHQMSCDRSHLDADGLRSLGLYDAATARDGLDRCLAQHEDCPIDDQEAARNPELAELLRRGQRQLHDALAEPDVSFIVTPVAAEARTSSATMTAR
jgi:hypothetical protein